MNSQNLIDSKIREIAQALGELWEIAKPRLLLHPEGYGLEILTDSRIKMKDRLIFVGHYDYEGDDLTAYTSQRSRDLLPTITVSMNREAEAIAHEISTRLLPRYLEERTKLLRTRNIYREQRWKEQCVAINLRNALGARDAQHEQSKVWRDFPCRADQRVIKVQATAECWYIDAPVTVRVFIQGLSPEEAEELLIWTQKINPIEDEIH
ncbi:MAG: hypothetical protein J0L70_29945 [Leptolyngbya sp. UWPOB_LEPTO1]|uniref:hypothetical protein n=1 Tax=Leptolyngbya sp. UWPOB_LEPTO1 TaxID=2815653 RepID=UPI001AC47DA1|nr:hypothetical protein [Leptolyngbya sp. UWPOB_LEPTO1]MBN8564759.1 hypothetical protein [Leptolyngbya sp. UWPOB_LEPTO1]